MNAEAVRINNKPAGEAIGKTHWEEWPGSVGTPVEAAYRKAMTERVALHLEHHYEYENLYDVWLDIHVYPTDEGLGIYYHDITQRKKAEQKLLHSQAALAEAESIARMGSWELDMATGQTSWSAQMYRLMGVDPGGPVPPKEWFLERVHVQDRPDLERNMEAALEFGQPFSQVFRLWVASAQWAWVEARVRPEPGPNGMVHSLAGILIDISELQESALQLRRHLSELDALNAVGRRVSASLSLSEVVMWALEAILEETKPDAAFLFLRQGDRLVLQGFAPEKAKESYGDMPEHHLGKCLCGMAVSQGRAIYSLDIHRDSRCTWQECKEAQMQSFAALPLRSGEDFFGVIGLSSKLERNFEAQAKFLETLASQVATGISNAMLHDSVLQNQTQLEMRVAERTHELAQARDRAEAADRVKSAFLATMSHELRTPLNSIIGFTGIMLQGHPGPLNLEQKKQLGMVQHSARHLLELINDVLDISKIEAGELELFYSNTNLMELMQDVLGLVAPMAKAKGLELDFESNQGFLEMSMDSRRLKQVVLNIVNNAVKFTEMGGVRVGCHRHNGQVSISVADTGIGIDPQKIATIFQPFSQIDNGLTRSHEGTGLGLSISLKLAQLMGGHISVASIPGEGSTFTIHLPISKHTET
jgi:signal transduction histidine kinase/PAS domain-containing protein